MGSRPITAFAVPNQPMAAAWPHYTNHHGLRCEGDSANLGVKGTSQSAGALLASDEVKLLSDIRLDWGMVQDWSMLRRGQFRWLAWAWLDWGC